MREVNPTKTPHIKPYLNNVAIISILLWTSSNGFCSSIAFTSVSVLYPSSGAVSIANDSASIRFVVVMTPAMFETMETLLSGFTPTTKFFSLTPVIVFDTLTVPIPLTTVIKCP